MSGLFTGVDGQIEKGILVLKNGGLVAFPTDTVYGLGACFSDIAAVERIYRLKQRQRNMGLPLLVADAAQMQVVAANISPAAWLLLRRFMPGALTLVLPKAESVPDIVTGGVGTVAVRIPNHPVPLALIRGVGMPIIGTSANISGRPSPLAADEVLAQFGSKLELVIDGGRCPVGRESTIVDVSGDVPRLLRQGAISLQELEQVCQIQKGE